MDCANCAAKMERSVQKIQGVTAASVNFFTQKITVETDRDSLDEIMQEGKNFPVECQFCDTIYEFTPDDVKQLLENL